MTGAVSDAATEQYDLIIIGSGSGNSIPEFLDGWKIALVERDVFGGTCLNRGCIPSKMFVLPADVALAADTSAKLGIDTQFNGADWPMIRDRIFGRIDPISAGGREYRATGTPNVTLIEGTARFVGDKIFAIDVPGAAQRTITAPHVLVAAGSRPTIPPIAGLNECGFHTSDSIMRLAELPEATRHHRRWIHRRRDGSRVLGARVRGHVVRSLDDVAPQFRRPDRRAVHPGVR